MRKQRPRNARKEGKDAPALVQSRAGEVHERLGLDRALFLHLVHVDAVAEAVAPACAPNQDDIFQFSFTALAARGQLPQRSNSQRDHIRRQTRKTDIRPVRDREHLSRRTASTALALAFILFTLPLSKARTRNRRRKPTFSKFVPIVSCWLPSRRSDAIATQLRPAIARTEPPLSSMIDCARAPMSEGVTRARLRVSGGVPWWAEDGRVEIVRAREGDGREK